MDFVTHTVSAISSWMRPYAGHISIAIVATLLVISGSAINHTIRTYIQPYHFLIRTLVFILLCTFGYGMLSILLTPYVRQFIAGMGNLYLAPVVVLLFLLLGFLAERQRS